MNWWQQLILRRYETHGLADKHVASMACLAEILGGHWQVFAYEQERAVFILGRSRQYPEAGEVHMWADGGNLLKAIRQFMRDAWSHSDYPVLTGVVMNSRLERCIRRFGWRVIGVGVHGERYWMAQRYAS